MKTLNIHIKPRIVTNPSGHPVKSVDSTRILNRYMALLIEPNAIILHLTEYEYTYFNKYIFLYHSVSI